MPQQGQYSTADIQQAAPPPQTGKYSVADLASAPGSPAPLTPDQLNQLRAANANRSPLRKILGLAPEDTQGAQLDQQAMESQQSAMAESPTVKQQIGTAALGTGIIGAGVAIPAAVNAAPIVGRGIVQGVKAALPQAGPTVEGTIGNVTKWAIQQGIKGGGIGGAWYLLHHFLGGGKSE